MTRKLLTAAALLLLALTGLRAQLNWEKTNGPDGCFVKDFAQDSTGGLWAIIHAPKGHDLLRSTDDGQSWQEVSVPLFQDIELFNMEVGPNGYLYLLDIYHWIYRSTDGGATWTAHDMGDLASWYTPWSKLAFLPTGEVLALGGAGNVWKSTDFGDTWAIVSTLPGTTAFQNISVLPGGLVFASGSNPQSKAFVWRSSDGGLTWQQVYANGSGYNDCTQMEEVGGSLVFQGNLGVFRSTDGGLSWSQIIYSSSIQELEKLPDGQVIIADSEGPILKSSNGLNWSAFSQIPGGITENFRAMIASSSGALVLNSAEMYRRSTSGNWTDVSEGIHYASITSVEINPFNKALYAFGHGVFRTDDFGQNWQRVHDAFPTASGKQPLEFSANGSVYALTPETLLRNPGTGTAWDVLYPDINTQYPLQSLAVAPSGKLFVQTKDDGLFTSTTNGDTWENLPSPPNAPFWLHAVNDTLLFAQYGYNNSARRSLDGGQSWQPLSAPNAGPPLGSDNFFWAEWGELFACANGGLYRSSDLGSTWTKVNLPPPYNKPYIERLVTTEDGQMYALNKYKWLIYSDDFGHTWVGLSPDGKIGDPALECSLFDIALLKGRKLFGATPLQSVWQTGNVSPFYAKLSGDVKKDQNSNCAVDSADLPVENWTITATGQASTTYASTDSTGHYRLGYILPDTAAVELEVEAHAPNYLWGICDPVLTATVSQQIDTANHLDFSAVADADCPLLDVSINFWPARPCSTFVMVAAWCNAGAAVAVDAKISVVLDAKMTVNSTSLPIFSQSGDTLVFAVGDVGIGACGSLFINGTLSCDVAVGQSICVEAHASPDSICGIFPDWSGATLQASAECVGDSMVDFTIKNIGSAASTIDLEYIVIEDQILLKTGKLPSLTPGQTMPLSELANGSMFRIEAQQEPGHPLSTYTAAWSEGCGSQLNPPIWGWALPFLGEDGDPFSATFCREVRTSYDPNAKEALPAGVGPEHFIKPGQPLEYTIQFQNTGNDTAFLVVLRDTLDASLDPTTIRMGPSSHAMDWEIYGPGILKQVFKNILLPDSTANEAASHGFASFTIEQRPGLPLGTVIRNKAGIYFDSNAPVLTNETWHTLGENFLPVSVFPSPESAAVLTVSPNPMGESAVFELKNGEKEGVLTLKIMDATGRVVRTETVRGPRFEVFRKGLPTGIWVFSLEREDGLEVASGKLVAH